MITSEGAAGPLVIDIGSSCVRAGFAGCAKPSFVEKCLLGRSEKENKFPISFEQPCSNTEVIPIWKASENAIKGMELINEDSLYGILEKTVKDYHTGYRSEEAESSSLTMSPVLISEPSVQNVNYRQKVIQYLFEKLGARAAFVCKRSVLSAFSLGKTNALVVSVGAGVTGVSCVVGGHASQHFYSSWNVAGNALDAEVRDRLRAQNANCNFLPKSYKFGMDVSSSFLEYAEMFHVRRMKEEVCRVAENKDIRVNVSNAAYELPDGTLLDCSKVAQSVPEMVFSGKGKNLGLMVQEVIEKQKSADESLATSLLESVVVCGGSTAMTGFTERVQNDLSQMYSGSVVKCFSGQTSEDKQHSAWIGGSIVGSLGAFANLWITKREYEEHGIGIVGKKCP